MKPERLYFPLMTTLLQTLGNILTSNPDYFYKDGLFIHHEKEGYGFKGFSGYIPQIRKEIRRNPILKNTPEMETLRLLLGRLGRYITQDEIRDTLKDRTRITHTGIGHIRETLRIISILQSETI